MIPEAVTPGQLHRIRASGGVERTVDVDPPVSAILPRASARRAIECELGDGGRDRWAIGVYPQNEVFTKNMGVDAGRVLAPFSGGVLAV
jgi:hypothetical protein